MGGDFRPPIRSDFDRDGGAKWYECCMCGSKRTRGLVHFDSGSVTPTLGETITGATSGDTGVLTNYTKTGGTVAGGDAVGILEMQTLTGYDELDLGIFENDENLNGSVSGNNFATVNKTGAVQISGRLIPNSEIVEYQGKYYCRPHFLFKFRRDWEDEAKIDTATEGDRE